MVYLKNLLVTGGAGYVGAVLVPKLLYNAYNVRVLDNFLFDEKALEFIEGHPNLEVVNGDLRDEKTVKESLKDID